MFSPDLISEARVSCGAEIASKKRLLETLAELLANDHPRLNTELVFERLLERERLGSTGLGHGVALPHARIKEINEVLGAFVSTSTGVDYDAIDGEPVDLAFALLVPESATEEHLRLLARLAGMFSDPATRAALREAGSAATVLQLIETSEAR
ncbi:PTS sugar transporter subunit IIA [Marichromatium gracile]|uniref:PTS sugar transporter subunit IIA n=1 Tax=Marichromatium gracile TaxID=1048 RepID=A0ABR5VIB9_MARGR|nr:MULTISPECIES: PTS sugar transporter subunit IIA [Marichromatium]KXX65466.1 PTS sugar transporter subunit IIA [Marichromatium gracile]MCF1183406.1 PTS sugar transporter subunit IIA [Marichromatium gracile]RNE91648.1 PTS sugar transporter subunit IIA [Marichromatium sp. AB31]